MGTGYTRNDTSNNIADGNIINAADLDGEFDAIESAMGTSGHTHDGTSAEGGPVTVLGPVQDFVASATEIKPKTTNTLDIGTSGLLFKDMFLDGVATVGSIKIDNAGTIGSASDGDAIAISSGGVVSFSQNTIGKTGSGYVLSLQTSDTTIEATNVLGKIEFSAPDEASGTDAILVGASIEALAEDTFDSSTNSTALVFKTNTTGAATERMRLTSAGDLHFLDDRKAIFGAGSDLQIYSDGTNSWIEEHGGGDLYIEATNLTLRALDNTVYATFTDSGAATINHAGAQKFTTTSTGISVTGDATFADNGKAIFGASGDLQIYHDGSNSYIKENGTGQLVVNATNLYLRNSDNTQDYLTAVESGATKLLYADAVKLATTSTGVDITGTLTSDGLTVDGSGSISTGSSGGSAASNADDFVVEAGGDGGISILTPSTNTGTLFFGDNTASNAGQIKYSHSAGSLSFITEQNERMRIDSSGNVGIGTSSPRVVSNYSIVGINGTSGSAIDFELGEALKTSMTQSAGQFEINVVPALPMVFKTSNAEAMRIDSIGNVKLSGGNLEFSGGTNDAQYIKFGDTDDDDIGNIFYYHGNNNMVFTTNTDEAMRIDSDGNVGIGTSSPDQTLHVWKGNAGGVSSASSAVITIENSSDASLQFLTPNNVVNQIRFGDVQDNGSGIIEYNHSNAYMAFNTNGPERMRIDSSGNVGIGTDSPVSFGANTAGLTVNGSSGSHITWQNNGTSVAFAYNVGNNFLIGSEQASSDTIFVAAGAEKMRIDSSGNVGIGVTPSAWRSSTDAIQIGQSASISSNNNANAVSFTSNAYINSSNDSVRISTGKATNYYQYDGAHVWDYAGSGSAGTTISYTEAMRIDSAGALRVANTTGTLFDSSSETGVVASTSLQVATSGSTVGYFNRQSSIGQILGFYQAGVQTGGISTNTSFYVGQGDTGLGFYDVDNIVFPANVSTSSQRDNAIDLGYGSGRFDDIYATNGTIQTSDRNEKQDIAELTDAEQRVAVAAKGLLRKFRWRDAVEAKGDEARTHFGIIAQDLQAAFAAEGLDAGDYAMFISSTWTDEETGEERTRMGVRYSELLAFIIAAI